VAIPVGLDFVPFADDGRHKSREPFRHATLDEKGALHPKFIKHPEHPLHVADNALCDRSVVIDAGLIPILNVDRKSGCGNIVRRVKM
jgi:hypothetical protein